MKKVFNFRLLVLLGVLIMSINQLWATQNINKAYLKASFNGSAVLWDGSNDEYTYNGSGHSDFNLGTLTGDFIITYVSWKAYADWKQNTDFYLYYNTDGSKTFVNYVKQNWNTTDWKDAPGDYYPYTTGLSRTVASVTDGSGEYDFQHYFYANFGGYGGGNESYLSNGGSNYHFKYKILPPDVSDFTITATSGALSGAGTEGNPYLVEYGGTLQLDMSDASKAHTDANSDAQYSIDNSSWGTATANTRKTISGITSTDVQSVNLYARFYNSSTLIGTVKTKTVYYRVATYTITLDDNGSYIKDGSATAAYKYNKLFSITVPERTGYHVDGYYGEVGTTTHISDASGNLQSNKTVSTTPYTNASSQWVKQSATTLYTKWAANTYTITLNKGTSGTADGSATVDYDAGALKTKSDATKTGYSLTGYYTGGGHKVLNADGSFVSTNAYISDYIGTGDKWVKANNTTLYAQWTPNSYSIVFNKNDNDATGSMSNQAMTYDAAANLTSNSFELEGYAFIGWATSPGGGVVYSNGESVSNLTSTPSGTFNLYAKWAPAYTVTIAAKVGDTTIPKDEYDPDDHTFIANTTLAVSQSAPIIAGYDFSSWTLDANLTSADETANPIAVTASDEATLTANYTYHSYTVTYPSNAAYTISNNDASVTYKNTGHFTITPTAGYSIVVTAKQTDHPEVDVPLSHVGDRYSFVQGTEAVTIVVTPTEVTNTVTIVNGTASSTTAQVATATGTATVYTAPTGKKFAYWSLGTGISLVDCETTSRTITFHASQNTTVTAIYTDRDTKTVHFAKPYGWADVKAMFYKDDDAQTGNLSANSTSTYEGATYHTFTYYVDNTGEPGGDQSAQNNWNKVVFSDGGDNVLAAKTINNGYYYAIGAEEADGRSTPYAEWYMRGKLNGEENWTSNHYARPFDVEGESATFAFGVTVAGEQFYRIYRISNGDWYRYGKSSSEDTEISFNTSMTLSDDEKTKADKFTSELGVYMFTLTNLDSDAPSLTVTHPEDTKYRARVYTSAHGTISATTDTITQLGRYIPKDIEATAHEGYRFKEWVTTGGAVVADPTNPSTTATATADGTITATFTNEYIVYLDKADINAIWTSTPYVYFYSGSYWDNAKGSGSKNILWGGEAMRNITGTTIWYYDYSGTKLVTDSKQYIAFTNGAKNGQDNFDEASVIYRSDYYPEMNMYVPNHNIDQYLNKHDSKQSAYYEHGYWMKYNEEMSGYNLRIYDGQGNNLLETLELNTATPGSRNSFTVKFNIEGAGGGKVELEGHDQGLYHGVDYKGTYYGNRGSIDASIANWVFEHGVDKAYMNFVSDGEYTFTLNCATDGQLKLSVTYPLAVGDFRIKCNGLLATTDGEKSDAYSNVIPQLTEDGTRTDKVSFFVTNPDGKEAALSLQECTGISGATITWSDAANTFTGDDAISGLETGVYVFEIVQTRTSGTISFAYNLLGTYSGNYYIRTDCAHGGWAVYRQDDHIMHQPNYAGAGFDLGFCRYVPSGSVKFCIANDYSPAITKNLGNDAINATSGDGTLNNSANTRFEYVKSTNAIRRSYIGSSANKDFLYLRDAIGDKIYKANTGPLLENDTAKFTDTENWIYTLEVEAIPNATYKLEAKINGNLQYFVGGASTSETLVGGDGDNKQKMRLIFDYKNNHMIKAWMPNGVISGDVAIEADVMLMREGQAAADELQFNSSSDKLSKVHNVYGVMGFKKDTLTNNKPIGGDKSSPYRTLYWISYPFDVKLTDIFGFGTFGEDYIIRRYNGALRAEKGWFKGDGTTTFWETMDPESNVEAENTMKAYEGYMLALDKGLTNSGDSRWTVDGKAIAELYLYFPSSNATVGTLSEANKVITLDSLPCRIDKAFPNDPSKNHKITDSNWRVIGVGSLQNASITATDLKDGSASFSYYAWDPSDNKLGATPVTAVPSGGGSATVFHPGHAVMIQWAGKLTWVDASRPAGISAHRMPTENKNYNIKLNLCKGGDVADHTYVILQDNASAEFVLNEDLYKAMNSNLPNIYAFAGGYDCGISRIPIENTTVAIGVVASKAGEYTFSMPNNFSGTVTLVDKFAQTRTNLALEDYSVYLNKGTIDDRFALEININNAPTAIDGVTDGSGSLKDGKAHKYIENGVMYILKDGVIYNAQGSRVK